VVALKKKHI